MTSSLTSEPPVDARVRVAFDRAASTYDAAAEFQRLICDRLIEMLPGAAAPGAIADLGCGTGYTSDRLALRFARADIVALDFAPRMLDIARKRARARHWIAADVQRLPLASASMDLLCSSLALQWCVPSIAFAEAARVLRPGGRLAIATVGPGTLGEIADAFGDLDRHDHVRQFRSHEELEHALRAAGFTVERSTSERLTLHRPNLRAILHELRAIGANNAGPRRRREVLGRAAWRAVEQRYERLRQTAGLPVTYAALYLIARR